MKNGEELLETPRSGREQFGAAASEISYFALFGYFWLFLLFRKKKYLIACFVVFNKKSRKWTWTTRHDVTWATTRESKLPCNLLKERHYLSKLWYVSPSCILCLRLRLLSRIFVKFSTIFFLDFNDPSPSMSTCPVHDFWEFLKFIIFSSSVLSKIMTSSGILNILRQLIITKKG